MEITKVRDLKEKYNHAQKIVGGLIMMPIPAVSVTTAALIAMLFTTF